MAKELVAYTWCEVEFAQGEKVPGQTFVLSLNAGKPKEVDLCEVHEKELIEPIRLLLEEAGQPVGAPPAKGKKSAATATPTLFEDGVYVRCIECQRPQRDRQAYSSHLLNSHAPVTINDPRVLEQLYGGSSPVEGPHKHKCPDCIASFTTATGLGGHRRSAHDYVSPNSAEWAEKNAAQRERKAAAND